jgi:K+-sensing histidine kinase KdpD
LRIEIPENVWPVEIDASELELALVNMVLNSREAMPQGGTITISAENVRLPDSGSAKQLAGDFVELRIIDTGSGIPTEVLPKIFDPFFTTRRAPRALAGLSQVCGFIQPAVRSARKATSAKELKYHALAAGRAGANCRTVRGRRRHRKLCGASADRRRRF